VLLTILFLQRVKTLNLAGLDDIKLDEAKTLFNLRFWGGLLGRKNMAVSILSPVAPLP